MKSHPFFQRRHYEAIATWLWNYKHEVKEWPEHQFFINDLCLMFQEDNSNFDEQRFLIHAGLKEERP